MLECKDSAYLPVGFMNRCHKVFFSAMWSDAMQHWEDEVGWLTFVLNAKFYNLTAQDDNLLCSEMIQLIVLRPRNKSKSFKFMYNLTSVALSGTLLPHTLSTLSQKGLVWMLMSQLPGRAWAK